MSKKMFIFILSVVNYRDGSEKQVLLLEGRLRPVLYFPIYKKKINRPLIPSYYIFHMYACFGITTNITKVVIISDIS